MQQLDRINAPAFSSIDKIYLKELSSVTLKNGAVVYYVNTPNTAVLKIDFVYNAGLRNQLFPGQATATNAMLSEGTSQYTAKQLADNLDQFGSYLQAKTNTDDSQITLYCLPKFLPNCVPYVQAVLTDCIFPETELETYKTNSIQRFLINNQRNSFLGRRAFYGSIFGKQNAYGSLVNIEDYQNISRETVSSFYANNILPGFKYIMVSGDVTEAVLKEMEAGFGALPFNPAPLSPIHLEREPAQTIFIQNDYSVQSSIKIGRSFVNRNHPDFNKLQLLNLALGGYFGSRLMKNIREEKGLTYGIFSAMESYLSAGAFYIETEINNDLREIGRTEILGEIQKLREYPMTESELTLVKNYMLGSFLRGIDGPFSLIDRYKMLIDYGFTYQYYQNFVDTIKQTTAQELLDLAHKYLQEDSLTTVIVGKK
jgi:zinc protease